jgi:hypothetical protein
MNNKCLDIVIGGPDYSGSSTQINDAISFFKNKGLVVRDLRGDEADALFHSEIMIKNIKKTINEFKNNYKNFKSKDNDFPEVFSSFLEYKKLFRPLYSSKEVLMEPLLNNEMFASCIKNDVSYYVNPADADVWVLEEPTRRGVGADIRSVGLHASKFNGEVSQTTKAQIYSFDRLKEFIRFRGPLRSANKIILRSRSEESACYQIYDEFANPFGISLDSYLSLDGNKVAFKNYPSHIISVSGLDSWTIDDMIALRKERGNNRITDDLEKDAKYQLLVNQRYGGDWLHKLYSSAGCDISKIEFFNLPIMQSKESTRLEIQNILENAIQSYKKYK